MAGILVELAGRAGATDPWQSGPICVNVGVMELVTTISIDVDDAHCPAAGVKVYVVVPTVAVLIVAGLQVPVMAGILVELAGSKGATDPWQRGPIWVNVGVMLFVTTMFIVAVAAHCPAAGVKV